MSPTDAPIRTALVGYGFAGKTFHVPLLHATEGLALTHVVSSRPDAVHADLPDVVVVPDVDALLARHDMDLVVIAAPNDQHTPLARTALRAGRHVVVDKPFTLSLAEARELRDLAAETGRVLRVFQNRRFDSDFLGIAELVRSGRLGDVVHLESRIDRFRPTVRDRWREAAVPGGGIWFDLGPHLVDQALLLFGVPERVDADLAALRPGATVEDWAHCVLQYPGRRVVLQASMLVAGGSSRFAVHGTRGTAVKELPDQQEAQLRAGLFQGFAQFHRVGEYAAGHLAAAEQSGFVAIDDGDADFTVTFGQRPGDALERLERTVGDQKGFVDTQRGVHGACLSV